jgi:Right handed beta helix region
VMGRRPGSAEDPQPPRWDRHGIPNLGPCVRCNFQIEGSGVAPENTVIDAGRVESGNGAPIRPIKDVAIRADRADGFVLRNLTTRHAGEHNIYVLESDGYRLERFKTYYAGEYGVLTFVEDHGLMQNCEAKGHGDAGLYPGAAADTGEQTVEPQRRYNQEVRFCDSHHNAAGYSGTTGNAVHVHHNRFYGNALGLTTDVFTASGHPGFPSDSILIENNEFYSNNFNPYQQGSDVKPTVPFPVGTGMWIAGGNNMSVRNNRFWDNWRRGTMVFAVPDAFVCGPAANGNEQAGCDPGQVSTSHRNRHHGNVMGRDPQNRFDPNGTDFWWDEFFDNRNNCWYSNTGKHGSPESITSEPSSLPSDCETSRGMGSPVLQSELLNCLGDITFNTSTCPWFTTPPEPQS